MCVYIYVYIYILIYACVYVYIYAHAHTHVCTYVPKCNLFSMYSVACMNVFSAWY